MRRLCVRDVMTREVLVVHRTTPVKEVATILAGRRVSAVPVVAEDRTVAGVVSEADLVGKEIPPGRWARRPRKARYAARTAGEVMTAPARTIGPEEPVAEAARRMTREGVKRFPVVDRDGTLVGIVSRADLVAVFVREDEALRAEIVHDVLGEVLLVPAKQAEAVVAVEDGVVTLSGELERKSIALIAVSLTRRIPGVVDVVDDLTFGFDDTHLEPTEPTNRGIFER